jgi:hypothetical protein
VDAGQASAPRPPADLRPAQLGIVLVGRVILGHVSATLVDLAQRGVLSLDETHDGLDEVHNANDGDWLLIDRRSGVGSGGDALLDFERTLLDGLFYGNAVVRMSGLGETFLLPMNQMRKQLRRDAVRNGWMRRWSRGKRTSRGEQLLNQIHDFRRQLRVLAASGDAEAMARLAPYAMILGVTRAASPSSADVDSVKADRDDHKRDEIGWAQAARLAQGFAEAFRTVRFRALRVLATAEPDFAHEWSGQHGHEHDHGSGQGHSYGESYGGHMGGGHMTGGGHGGH